jgi:hypothetical protein
MFGELANLEGRNKTAPMAEASTKMNFDRPDSLPIERIKAGLTEIALAFVFFAGVMTFGLACFFFLQRFC